jgi:hypothetical protein
VLGVVAFLFLIVIPIFGQSALSPTTPSPALENVAAPPTPVDYFFPDVPADVTKFDFKPFDIRLGFVVLADYTFIGQDSS